MISGPISILIASSGLCLLCGLFVFSARLNSITGRWLLFIGVILFPLLGILIGTETIFEKAKSPEFCGSCHVMTPYLNDLKNSSSENLAAIHYQNKYIQQHQCFTCHSDYTIFGPAKAKLSGFRHWLFFQTGHYTLPLKHLGPYDFGICLQCHEGSKKYRAAHDEDLRNSFKSGGSCLDCHARPHPGTEPAP